MNDKNFSVIVFDLGNVLIPFDYNIAIRRFNEIEMGLGEKYYSYTSTNKKESPLKFLTLATRLQATSKRVNSFNKARIKFIQS